MPDFWEGYRTSEPHRFKEEATGNEVWFDALGKSVALVSGTRVNVYEGPVVGRLRARLEEVEREAQERAGSVLAGQGVSGPAG